MMIRKEAEEEEEEEDPDIAKIKKVQSFFRGWLCRWQRWYYDDDDDDDDDKDDGSAGDKDDIMMIPPMVDFQFCRFRALKIEDLKTWLVFIVPAHTDFLMVQYLD